MGSITIGGLTVDLSPAICRATGETVPCAAAFSAGQIVSAFGAKRLRCPRRRSPRTQQLLRGKIAVETPGASGLPDKDSDGF